MSAATKKINQSGSLCPPQDHAKDSKTVASNYHHKWWQLVNFAVKRSLCRGSEGERMSCSEWLFFFFNQAISPGRGFICNASRMDKNTGWARVADAVCRAELSVGQQRHKMARRKKPRSHSPKASRQPPTPRPPTPHTLPSWRLFVTLCDLNKTKSYETKACVACECVFFRIRGDLHVIFTFFFLLK